MRAGSFGDLRRARSRGLRNWWRSQTVSGLRQRCSTRVVASRMSALIRGMSAREVRSFSVSFLPSGERRSRPRRARSESLRRRAAGAPTGRCIIDGVRVVPPVSEMLPGALPAPFMPPLSPKRACPVEGVSAGVRIHKVRVGSGAGEE